MAALPPKSAVHTIMLYSVFHDNHNCSSNYSSPQKLLWIAKCCTRWHHFLRKTWIRIELYNIFHDNRIFHDNPYSVHEAWLSFIICPRVATPASLFALSAAALCVETLLAHTGFFLTAFILLWDSGLSKTALRGLHCASGWEWSRSLSRAPPSWVIAVSELPVLARKNHGNEFTKIEKRT
jgi:hypothetical protein